MDKTTILILEDEADIREGIRIMLSGEGYRVLEAPNGYQALRMMNDDIDLVILDVLMPGMSGFQVCEELRKEYTAPILFLTALAQERDKLTGLTAGGDDYLIKPFSFSELIARVKVLLRRYHVYQGKETASSGHENDLIALNGITISRISNQVWIKGKKTELTETEYRILLFLMSHPKRVISAQELYESIWKESYFHTSGGTIMVHIRKLRLKIEPDAQNPRWIKTVWGKGYRFGSENDYETT